mgnify:CR=1 FL=1
MNRVIFGDCRDTMRDLKAQGVRVQCCVTSPPYFGLRDYGHPGQIGLEKTPANFAALEKDAEDNLLKIAGINASAEGAGAPSRGTIRKARTPSACESTHGKCCGCLARTMLSTHGRSTWSASL